MNNINLTIMVPTYNRKTEICRLMDCLVQQKNQFFNVLIQDNCSSNYDIYILLQPYSEFFGSRLKIIRNINNIGGTANICKIFSEVNTKWAWLMGDDDYPNENATEMILSYVDDTVAALHFSLYDLKSFFKEDYKDIEDLEEFVYLYSDMNWGRNRIKNSQGDLICMSEIVYNMELCLKYYEKQNTFTYTKVSQILPFLYALDFKDGKYRLINKKIIDVDDSNQCWRMGPTMLGMSTFSHIKFNSLKPDLRCKLDLIVIFKYQNLLRYWLNGEVSRIDMKKIYDGIFKYSLPVKDKVIYNGMLWVRPNGVLAKMITRIKDKKNYKLTSNIVTKERGKFVEKM